MIFYSGFLHCLLAMLIFISTPNQYYLILVLIVVGLIELAAHCISKLMPKRYKPSYFNYVL
jgi:hypothetical protein